MTKEQNFNYAALWSEYVKCRIGKVMPNLARARA